MMFGNRRVRVFACASPTDLRKSFDTLAERVRADLDQDPLSGDLFLFVNARRNRAKILLWDGTGLCIYMKRLEKGQFAAPWRNGDTDTIAMTSSELALFLEGSPFVFVGRLSPPEVHEETVATPREIAVRTARCATSSLSSLSSIDREAKTASRRNSDIDPTTELSSLAAAMRSSTS